ncbi:MAG: serine ammonia-lyase [bacterium]|nr:serine ammonia-lyase [bacterium]
MESNEYVHALPTLRAPTPPFDFDIEICSLKQIDHPNLVELSLTCVSDSLERTDSYLAISAGGGIFEILQYNDNRISIDGSTYAIMIECRAPISFGDVLECFSGKDLLLDGQQDVDEVSDFWLFRTCRELNSEELALLSQISYITLVREAAPVQLLVSGGRTVFSSGKEVLELCANISLPKIAVHYESELLGLTTKTVEKHFVQRAQLMLKVVEEGLERNTMDARYKFLEPTAGRMLHSQAAKVLTGDTIHLAISGAMSVMETNTMRGIVCACPTAGSAGIIPGCLYSLKQAGHSMIAITDALKVAGVVGAIIGIRATFAAELAGCMVETGSAAAMAAAGLAHVMDAPPETAFNASAISLMNTLGLVCDPVGSALEVPCYARNIAGVGHAFVAASASIGGFKSFIPFDEVVDALPKVGKCMPSDLRCTSRGGLAVTPTALTACKKN